MNQVAPLPPGYEANPLAYGGALFALLLILSVSTAMLLQFWFEARAKRKASAMAANNPDSPADGCLQWNALTVHRTIVSGFLFSFILGTVGDVSLLLSYGEARVVTIAGLNKVDRFLDFAALLPFSIGAVLSAWGVQTIPQALIQTAHFPLKKPTWDIAKDKVKIAGAVAFIAAGITLAKAGL